MNQVVKLDSIHPFIVVAMVIRRPSIVRADLPLGLQSDQFYSRRVSRETMWKRYIQMSQDRNLDKVRIYDLLSTSLAKFSPFCFIAPLEVQLMFFALSTRTTLAHKAREFKKRMTTVEMTNYSLHDIEHDHMSSASPFYNKSSAKVRKMFFFFCDIVLKLES